MQTWLRWKSFNEGIITFFFDSIPILRLDRNRDGRPPSTTIHWTKGSWGGGSWHWASVWRKKTEGLSASCGVGLVRRKRVFRTREEMHYGVEFLSNVVMASNCIRTLSSSAPFLSSYSHHHHRLPFARIYSNVSKRRWIHWRWSRIISGPQNWISSTSG